MFNGRLLLAIITTALEETAIAVLLLVGLSELGIEMSLWLVVILMLAWLGVAVVIYRAGTRALKRRTYIGFDSMVGVEGITVDKLKPHGLVRIKGELWVAKAETESINGDSTVVVVMQKRTHLTVRLKE